MAAEVIGVKTFGVTAAVKELLASPAVPCLLQIHRNL